MDRGVGNRSTTTVGPPYVNIGFGATQPNAPSSETRIRTKDGSVVIPYLVNAFRAKGKRKTKEQERNDEGIRRHLKQVTDALHPVLSGAVWKSTSVPGALSRRRRGRPGSVERWGMDTATPSRRHRVDGVEDERAVKF